MQGIRKILCWLFGIKFLILLVHPLLPNRYPFYPQLPSVQLLLDQPVAFTFLVAVSIVFGVAWWVIWKGKPSARRWGIAASLANIMLFLQQLILPSDAFIMRNAIGQASTLIAGIGGIVVFARREKIEPASTLPGPEDDQSRKE
jgi:hypothetical protein